MDITYQEEAFDSIVEELKPLLYDHLTELANHKDIRPLDPNYESYSVLNSLGNIRIFTVRNEGKLIGYASFVISNCLHYKTWVWAVCDVYYLHTDYRKTITSERMFNKIEAWLKDMKVNSVMVQDKVNHSHQ